jgi:sterol desaturase/sphingolipid hydroxylase (fatty acid hydroxylase superfamily)
MLQNQLVEQELLKLSIPFYAIVILAEMLISNAQGKQWYSVKDTLYNVYLTLLNAGLDFLMRIVFVGSFMTWVYQYRLLEIQNPIYYWLTLLILEDFLFYWLHRMEHYSRFFGLF